MSAGRMAYASLSLSVSLYVCFCQYLSVRLFIVGSASWQREGRGPSGHGRLLFPAGGTHKAARGVRRPAVCRGVWFPRQRLDPLLQPSSGRETCLQEPAALHGEQAGWRRPFRPAQCKDRAQVLFPILELTYTVSGRTLNPTRSLIRDVIYSSLFTFVLLFLALLFLALCLQWYNGLLTPQVHSSTPQQMPVWAARLGLDDHGTVVLKCFLACVRLPMPVYRISLELACIFMSDSFTHSK